MYQRNLHVGDISQVERCTSKREIAQDTAKCYVILALFLHVFLQLIGSYHLLVPTIVQEMVRNNSNTFGGVQSCQLMEFCTKKQDSARLLTSNRHCRRDSGELLPNV